MCIEPAGVWTSCTFLRGECTLRKEVDKRQKTESGGLPVSTVTKSQVLHLSALLYPSQKGRAQDFPDTKNTKPNYLLTSQTPVATPCQTVTTPLVKCPVVRP